MTDPLPDRAALEPIETVVDPAVLAESRRRLLMDALGIAVAALGFGFVYGLAAREAGFSPIEVIAMSTIVFGGAAQFAAVGYVASGLAWPAIVLLTFLLNARHLLYSAALAPWLRRVPFARRAVSRTGHTLISFTTPVSRAGPLRSGRYCGRTAEMTVLFGCV